MTAESPAVILRGKAEATFSAWLRPTRQQEAPAMTKAYQGSELDRRDSTPGWEPETPTMRRTADAGLRYSNLHTTSPASPTWTTSARSSPGSCATDADDPGGRAARTDTREHNHGK